MSQPNTFRIRLFVNALRSGVFPQTRGINCRIQDVLDDDHERWGIRGFCCLGVATLVAALNGCEISGGLKDALINGSSLPHEVANWYGFDSHNPGLGQDEHHMNVDAICANDQLEWNFDRIADAFEAIYLTPAES